MYLLPLTLDLDGEGLGSEVGVTWMSYCRRYLLQTRCGGGNE